jgi:hypothetical protein
MKKNMLQYNGIAETLKKAGYSTTYFTTHDGQFDNVEGFLRNNAFEQAFRIHNTGKKDGITYDPNYVANGLDYMQRFGENQSIFVVQDLPEKFTNSHYTAKYNLDQHLVIYVDFSKPRTPRRLWVVENGQVIATSFADIGFDVDMGPLFSMGILRVDRRMGLGSRTWAQTNTGYGK